MNCDRIVGRYRVRAWLWMAVAAVVALCAFAGFGARAASFQTLEIATKSGVQVFSVEMATTEEEKTTGLMYRKELADGKGMLFDFSPEQQVSMWMKNTYIPLDMIFIRADGRILRIAENTEPLSTKIIPSERAGERGAGGDRRHRAKIRDRARRPGGASAVQWPLKRTLRLAGAALSVYRRRFPDHRGIAQPGSAAVLGTAGRWFESSCPDHPPSSGLLTDRQRRSFYSLLSVL